MHHLFPRTPFLDIQNVELLRQTIGDYFISTFSMYERLFETLVDDEGFFIKPISLRHPLIFYFGHTATFFVNKLILAGLLTERINPLFESMFSVGVDEMSWDDLNEANYAWPSVQEVRAYRHRVRETVEQIIRHAPLTLPVEWNHPWWAILMGIEHERIHLETSSVLIRQHALHRVKPHPAFAPCTESSAAPVNELIAVSHGTTQLGKALNDHRRYGWDNEYGERVADVPAFSASRYLVSNQEFLTFVQDEGYQRDIYWQEEGLAWRKYAQAQHPTFWVADGDTWRLRLMTQEIPMPWDWPAEVNYHEAKAFCAWKTEQSGLPVRLPSEDEWYRLYDVCGLAEIETDKAAHANLHLDHWASSCPVDRFAHGEFFDVVGNVWQWTETPIYPFEGFAVHPIYDDFTTPTFDGRHNLIKGGSWISCGNESLRSARYAFRRHFFQHAGFRYVVSDHTPAAPSAYYESDQQLAQYAEFHYGESYFGVGNFPQTLAGMALKAMQGRPTHKAMDLGCATGRATFELARHFDQVIGVDFSARFIQLGVQLAEQGTVRYTLPEEGDLVSYRQVNLNDFGLDKVRSKVEFVQSDACNLKSFLRGFDLVLAANLIDRLYQPTLFLQDIHTRINPGGILLIASPYTWLEEHTAREHWLGGFKKDGENFTTLDGLRALLGAHFRLLCAPQDVPFVIRETRRKFQHTVTEVTLWERIS
ncbi:MAG: 5-histidylcysteine sulfoxide synthase [Pseudomonadota bacterium]